MTPRERLRERYATCWARHCAWDQRRTYVCVAVAAITESVPQTGAPIRPKASGKGFLCRNEKGDGIHVTTNRGRTLFSPLGWTFGQTRATRRSVGSAAAPSPGGVSGTNSWDVSSIFRGGHKSFTVCSPPTLQPHAPCPAVSPSIPWQHCRGGYVVTKSVHSFPHLDLNDSQHCIHPIFRLLGEARRR